MDAPVPCTSSAFALHSERFLRIFCVSLQLCAQEKASQKQARNLPTCGIVCLPWHRQGISLLRLVQGKRQSEVILTVEVKWLTQTHKRGGPGRVSNPRVWHTNMLWLSFPFNFSPILTMFTDSHCPVSTLFRSLKLEDKIGRSCPDFPPKISWHLRHYITAYNVPCAIISQLTMYLAPLYHSLQCTLRHYIIAYNVPWHCSYESMAANAPTTQTWRVSQDPRGNSQSLGIGNYRLLRVFITLTGLFLTYLIAYSLSSLCCEEGCVHLVARLWGEMRVRAEIGDKGQNLFCRFQNFIIKKMEKA
jgi:hypothetical protein